MASEAAGFATATRFGPATTRAGAGTPGYWAPEVEAGGRASAASDVYSYGVLVLQVANPLPPLQILRATYHG